MRVQNQDSWQHTLARFPKGPFRGFFVASQWVLAYILIDTNMLEPLYTETNKWTEFLWTHIFSQLSSHSLVNASLHLCRLWFICLQCCVTCGSFDPMRGPPTQCKQSLVISQLSSHSLVNAGLHLCRLWFMCLQCCVTCGSFDPMRGLPTTVHTRPSKSSHLTAQFPQAL